MVTVAANASDNSGVVGVQFRLDGAVVGSEDLTSPYSISWNTALATDGAHTLTAVARDAAGNTGNSTPVNITISNVINRDIISPTVSITSPASGAVVSGTVAISANASDNVGVAGVQFQVDGANVAAEDLTSPYSVNWDTSAYGNGLHVISAIARDAAGNVASSVVTLTVSNGAPQTGRPMASYNFQENTGAAAADGSGHGNTAVLNNGAGWTTSGKYGNAVTFDGVDDFVFATDTSSLDIGGAGTIEAWVNPVALNRWNSIIAKGGSNDNTQHNYALEINESNRYVCILGDGSSSRTLSSTIDAVSNQFTHVACVWDGANLQLYINGALNSSTVQDLAPAANTFPLYIGQFGGNTDRFQGVIDEVRIYSQALTQAQVQSDMNTPL